MEQEARKYLDKNRLLHIDMLEALRQDKTQTVYAQEDGVLIHLKSADIHMLSAASESSMRKIAGLIKDPSVILLHQNYLKDEIMNRFSLKSAMPCHQAAWLKNEPVPAPPSGADIRLLGEADLPVVLKHYHPVDGPAYVCERLKAGMLGIFEGGELAGFIGTHSEGSIGLLEVLPAFRRRGLAILLESAMMRNQQALGCVPYAQIKQGNEASIALHKKLGMEVTEEASLCWLY
jgi:ribosomal protein S18 acetylase RimI-like enzyme